ncbi:MAG: cation-translocating P-type ATPase [Patescibacteria group bacterium]|nr:cation-translocating P-type ATPase [Patescibacteria group bacterium]MDE1940938.1 cation-translocating P-type ATPase [Patescibacteria group bacterium]MDE1966690.1 cation-translocating P-type ATPase [Patescibacteria group bacterium]
MTGRLKGLESKILPIFDYFLIGATAVFLIAGTVSGNAWTQAALAVLSFLGLLPVLYSAARSLMKKRVSVDLLASIALVFSLLSAQWASAAFITLMLAFARVFDHATDVRAKKIIQSLMKYHVERVRIRDGETVREAPIKSVKPGDLVIVEAGDRMPVDGVIVSGTADIDESSLTGESELIAKKPGDKVFTATVNDSGSLIVRTEKVGDDTTLARIIALVEEASRHKSKAERVADTFTQWYIAIMLIGSVALYLYGLSSIEILSILLVVCADDIAVAVPLAFTAAIARTAKRGVIVKGSAAYEQLSRVKYVLTDKTGTLTKGKPKIIDVKAYKPYTASKIIELAGMGASESKHAVSRAILDYLREKGAKVHVPHELEEVSGQGLSFRHGTEKMFLGRLSFIKGEKIHVPESVERDIELEKDAGRGIVVLAVDGHVAGLLSYIDQLRPRVKEIIAETKAMGVKEWHMLTGDNEHAAAAVAGELGIRHFHANMTPQSKVEFATRFEREKEPEVVAYIGDGVNDAASLALVDVSIAMGGIGSDAAIEAADITIMKDRLYRLPQTMRTAKTLRNIMWECFVIWAVTNAVGLVWATAGLPFLGVLGPSGAAAFNFLTDFIPIGNALRAGRLRKDDLRK